jgi:hypothetical protein
VASSYADVIEKIIRKMLESRRCVEKVEVVEAAKAEVETSPDALRVLVNRVLKRLAKRGEIYIFDTEICRGVHISHEVVKALEVWHTPHDLGVLFKIVMDMVKRGGRLDDFVFETLASAADAALKDGKSVGVVYEPSDVGGAILALAVFKLFRKWYSNTRGRGLAAVYLTLPKNVVMDLLQARPHVDGYKRWCVVDGRGATFVFGNTEECREECPPETQSQRLDSNIIGELAEILQLFNDHMDYMRRLLALATYIRIMPEEASRSEQL